MHKYDDIKNEHTVEMSYVAAGDIMTTLLEFSYVAAGDMNNSVDEASYVAAA